MISYLKGQVISKGSDSIILLVGGIGYKVFVGTKILALAKEGSDLALFCYLHLKREETIELYGLPSAEALSLFESLRGISGIGPKAALAISSLGNPQELKQAILQGDEGFFKGIHGVGSKKIQKVILELTGKIKTFGKHMEHLDDDAVDALVGLGFPRKKAREAVARVGKEIQETQARVKEALKFIRR